MAKPTVHKMIPVLSLPTSDGMTSTVEARTPQHALSDLMLATETIRAISQVLLEHKHAEALAKDGCRPATRVLFTGPPGTGKTSAAGAIARELGVHLLVAKQHEMIDSSLGHSEKIIARLFEYARATHAVFLFDEFDNVASARGEDKGGAGDKSYNAIATTILSALDRHVGPGLIIAATNRKEIIDRAARRRFDVEIDFPLPDETTRLALIKKTLGDHGGDFQGSHADIVRDCLAEKKRRILARLESKASRTRAKAPPLTICRCELLDRQWDGHGKCRACGSSYLTHDDIGSGALHGSMRHDPKDAHASMFCEHANEAPQTCPCSPGCPCKKRMCKTLLPTFDGRGQSQMLPPSSRGGR